MEPDQSAVDNEDLEGPCHLGDSSKDGRHKHDEGDEDHSPLPEKKIEPKTEHRLANTITRLKYQVTSRQVEWKQKKKLTNLPK